MLLSVWTFMVVYVATVSRAETNHGQDEANPVEDTIVNVGSKIRPILTRNDKPKSQLLGTTWRRGDFQTPCMYFTHKYYILVITSLVRDLS